MKAIARLLGHMIAALALAGCGHRETDVEAGIRTQTLLVGNIAEPGSLDPHIAVYMSEGNIIHALLEGLTIADELTGGARPGVAERWEISDDGLVATFHLRHDARWSNGDPVTAHDFAFAFRRALSPAFGSHYAYMLHVIRGAAAFQRGESSDFDRVGVETPDAWTLRLTLEHPVPYLPALAAHWTWKPLHRPTIEKWAAMTHRDTAWTSPGNYVGNGAFRLVEWRQNARVVVEWNETYWDAGHTRLRRIEFLPIEDFSTEERMFRAGQLHVTYGVPSAKVARYQADQPDLLRRDPWTNTNFLDFEVTHPPLNDRRIREALSLAIDRDTVCRIALPGASVPIGGLVPPGCEDYSPIEAGAPDIERARSLLAAAGAQDGRGIRNLEFLVIGAGADRVVAEVIAEMWRTQLGISTVIRVRDAKTFFTDTREHRFDIYLGGWVADFPDPINFLEIYESTSGNNWTAWRDDRYDAMLALIRQTADPTKRRTTMHTAETYLLEHGPIAPIFRPLRVYLIHPAVRGWEPAPLDIHAYQRVFLEN